MRLFVLEQFLEKLNHLIWGPATLCLFIGTGLFFLILLKGMSWRKLPYAIRAAFMPSRSGSTGSGEISSFASLMTSLGACMGTGNIVGVACAMVLGGPGALVWMCLSAMIGLPTIFAECVLAIKYRKTGCMGKICGGPMYVMHYGIGGLFGKVTAAIFALLTVGASFGIGNMTQANAVAVSVEDIWHVPKYVTGCILMIAVFFVLVGGIQSIGRVCSILVPAASLLYLVFALAVIMINYKNLGHGIWEIFRMAFSIKAVSGGLGGSICSTMFLAMKWGIARGVFSNEAGLGSAPIAAASAKTGDAVKQGYIHMTGAFFDTVIMCTVTGLAIAASGVLGMKDADGQLITGVLLTIKAFETIGKSGVYVIGAGMVLFAFPTLLGWAFYGEKALEYLVKSPKIVLIYRVFFCIMSYVGAVKPLQLVWDFSDIMNGLMAVPNLLCLWLLHKEVKAMCFDFQK